MGVSIRAPSLIGGHRGSGSHSSHNSSISCRDQQAFSNMVHEAMAKTEHLSIIYNVHNNLFSKWLLWGLVALPGELKHYDCNKKSFNNQVPWNCIGTLCQTLSHNRLSHQQHIPMKMDYHQYGPRIRPHGQKEHWTQPRLGRVPPRWHSQPAMPCPFPLRELLVARGGKFSASNLPKQATVHSSIDQIDLGKIRISCINHGRTSQWSYVIEHKLIQPTGTPLDTAKYSATNWVSISTGQNWMCSGRARQGRIGCVLVQLGKIPQNKSRARGSLPAKMKKPIQAQTDLRSRHSRRGGGYRRRRAGGVRALIAGEDSTNGRGAWCEWRDGLGSTARRERAADSRRWSVKPRCGCNITRGGGRRRLGGGDDEFEWACARAAVAFGWLAGWARARRVQRSWSSSIFVSTGGRPALIRARVSVSPVNPGWQFSIGLEDILLWVLTL